MSATLTCHWQHYLKWRVLDSMTTLTINLSDQAANRLRELARELGTSPEELAAEAVRLQIEKRGEDDFDALAQRVVQKNKELYRRLA
jgi:predicted transcriptional regulator